MTQTVFSWACFLFYSSVSNITKGWIGRYFFISPCITTQSLQLISVKGACSVLIQWEKRSRWPRCYSPKAWLTVAAGVKNISAASWPRRCTLGAAAPTKPAEGESSMASTPSLSLEAPASSKLETPSPMGPKRRATWQRGMEQLPSKWVFHSPNCLQRLSPNTQEIKFGV